MQSCSHLRENTAFPSAFRGPAVAELKVRERVERRHCVAGNTNQSGASHLPPGLLALLIALTSMGKFIFYLFSPLNQLFNVRAMLFVSVSLGSVCMKHKADTNK